MKMIPQMGLTYDDICLSPRHSKLLSRSDVDISSGNYSSPIIMSPMIHTCTNEMIGYFGNNGMCSTIHRYFDSVEEQYNLYQNVIDTHGYWNVRYEEEFIQREPFFAVGTVNKWKYWIDYLINCGISKYCVDLAHGDSILCTDTIKYIKSQLPNSVVMAGNVATAAGFAELEQAGADLIRVGIASGSICSTYLNTGVGVPIVTSIIECHKVRRRAKIIADGGVKHPGDIAKALAIGADYVMVGGLLAATSMSAGECYDINKELIPFAYGKFEDDIAYKEYAGMASTQARKHTKTQSTSVSVEGVSGLIKYRGDTDEYIKSVHNNLRSSLSYLGALNWKEFTQRAKVMQITSLSRLEKDTHVSY